MRLICFLPLLIMPQMAAASDLSVLGFELGKPVNLPECKFDAKISRPPEFKAYEPVQEVTCIQDARELMGYAKPIRTIVFNTKEAPAYVKNWRVFTLESDDGKLIGVEFLTPGASAQDAVMEQLRSKYGKPDSVEKHVVQNEFGATFDSVTAHWKRPSVEVTFEGITYKINTGRVLIDTPEAAQLRASWKKDERAPQRSL